MRITSLELTDVRKFRHGRFDFKPGFNLIVGENGAGKSTVLRSLVTALGGAENFNSGDRLSDDDIRHRSEEFQVLLEFESKGKSARTILKHAWRQKTTRKGKITETTPVLWFGANESTTTAFRSPKVRQHHTRRDGKYRDREEFRYREEFLYHGEYEEPPYDDERKNSFGRSEIVRRFVSEVLSSFSPKFHRFSWRFVPYECAVLTPEKISSDTRHVLEFRNAAQAEIMRFIEFEYYPRRYRGWSNRRSIRFSAEGQPLNEKSSMRPMPEFGDILRKVASEFKIAPEAMGIEIELKLGPRILVIGPDGPFLLSELSDGEKRIFCMIVDIARQLSLPEGGSVELAAKAGIVVIDEVDCHLHPKWQRMIVPTLERLFPLCQFIATTHSPFVIQATAPGKLFRIDGAPLETDTYSERSLEDIVEDVQGIDMPQRSKRAEDMSNAAEKYFRLLHRARKPSAEELHAAEVEYRKASEPFSNEPALNALLRIESTTTS